MARKKDSPIGVGMTAKQMKRKRPINADLLNKIEPITDNQKTLFENYKEGKNIFAYGAAGTGKTFTLEGLTEKLNAMSPGARISELRDNGFNVKSKPIHTGMVGRPANEYTISRRRLYS